jgi:RNA polymerase sigma-70 factor (ECF subfamily)
VVAAAAPESGEPIVSDETLVERIRAGESEAFELLYQRYFKRVYAFAKRRLRSREDTEEVVQEAFINVFSSIGSFRGEAPFSAWVLGLTRRTIASRFKRKRHATVPLLPEEEPEKIELPFPTLRREPTPHEHYEYRERMLQLERAARQLTDEQWRLFELHHLEERSIQDLAVALHKTQDSIKSNLYRARRVLLAR